MNQEKLEKYGNEYTIAGIIVGNAAYKEILVFPEERMDCHTETLFPSTEDLQEIFNQLDTLQITGLHKVVLRKSQRNIEQGVSWAVYRRDGYACRYCGADDVPLTVDHVVRWEMMGDSVANNLLCACRKCNKTRGNMEYPDWLQSDFYKKMSVRLTEAQRQANIDFWAIANKVPLRSKQRSR